jgi:hypothetical protein
MHHTAVESSAARAPGSPVAAELTLDTLARRSYTALEALYRAAPTPRSMHAVDGAPKGRMLAVRFIDGAPVAALLRAFAASPAFVWDGKTFSARSDGEGAGINRIRIPGALGRQDLFPFETRFAASAVDGAPALVLDYDLPRNPPWIRKVHDEIREVAPGLFLGPAMWKTASGPKTVLWFALDTRVRGDA